ncbi:MULTISPECIES: hypothetical protein [Clostridium]|uniref:Spo0E like sporulation regulatory protein n=1 Tax=Clostridium cibarium TaxID=2762247 RepID=A0ABR8PYW3_9CLOT|nr:MULTISPECIES: hypothetical protein [Clostridium]MBD7913358.1 hypothetical protein [Clostridium cibarium]
MRKIEDLEKKLKELKLEKRQILLAGKNTDIINSKIREIELKLKSEDNN